MDRIRSDRRGGGAAAQAAAPSSLAGKAAGANDVASRLREIASLDKPGLLVAWQELIEAPPPPRCRAELLRVVLAYRVQAQQFGGLSEAMRRRLRRLAGGETAAGDAPPPRQLKPGTRLLREWQGRTHTITITDSGFAYDGKAYRSLSQIARMITGTRWSGPLFFGLRDKRRGDADAAGHSP